MGDRELLALALQRMPSLRPDEKLLVWDLVVDEASFVSLSRRDIESLVSRRLGGEPWSTAGLLAAAEDDAALLARIGSSHVLFDDPRYPALLRETYRPPFGLFFRGAPLPDGIPCAAVVGTRMPTGRGLEAALDIGSGLAAAGVPVISGLARGIDSAAHRGTIDGGGFTCAVLPCGFDAIYPPSNKGLAEAILESGGLIVSEYAPGAEMHKYRFPERNRIIAGIARASVVVEAPIGSGALITADHALQEGRDVWVAAACAGGPRNGGADRLAAEGARALESAGDLLADWGISWRIDARAGGAPRGGKAARDSGPGSASAGTAGRRLAASLREELGLEAVGAEETRRG